MNKERILDLIGVVFLVLLMTVVTINVNDPLTKQLIKSFASQEEPGGDYDLSNITGDTATPAPPPDTPTTPGYDLDTAINSSNNTPGTPGYDCRLGGCGGDSGAVSGYYEYNGKYYAIGGTGNNPANYQENQTTTTTSTATVPAPSLQENQFQRMECTDAGGRYSSSTGICSVTQTSTQLEKTDEGFITHTTTIVRDLFTNNVVDSNTVSTKTQTTTPFISPQIATQYSDPLKKSDGSKCTYSSECGSGSCAYPGGRGGVNKVCAEKKPEGQTISNLITQYISLFEGFNSPETQAVLPGLGTYGLGGGNAPVVTPPLEAYESPEAFTNFYTGVAYSMGAGAALAGGTILLAGGTPLLMELLTPAVIKTAVVANLVTDTIPVADCALTQNPQACQEAAFLITNPIPGAQYADDFIDAVTVFGRVPKASGLVTQLIDTPNVNESTFINTSLSPSPSALEPDPLARLAYLETPGVNVPRDLEQIAAEAGIITDAQIYANKLMADQIAIKQQLADAVEINPRASRLIESYEARYKISPDTTFPSINPKEVEIYNFQQDIINSIRRGDSSEQIIATVDQAIAKISKYVPVNEFTAADIQRVTGGTCVGGACITEVRTTNSGGILGFGQRTESQLVPVELLLPTRPAHPEWDRGAVITWAMGSGHELGHATNYLEWKPTMNGKVSISNFLDTRVRSEVSQYSFNYLVEAAIQNTRGTSEIGPFLQRFGLNGEPQELLDLLK